MDRWRPALLVFRPAGLAIEEPPARTSAAGGNHLSADARAELSEHAGAFAGPSRISMVRR